MFVGGTGRRTLLPLGTTLYKFTEHPMPLASGARVSPWWASVAPLPGFPDPGLDGHLARAEAAGLTALRYAREWFAVMFKWNSLGGAAVAQNGLARVQLIRLAAPVYGFAGPCQRVTDGPTDAQAARQKGAPAVKGRTVTAPTFAGGAIQIYIPNLTTAQVADGGSRLV